MSTEYRLADEDVVAVMDAVIDRHTKFADLRKHDVRIEVLMAWADNNEPVKKHGAVAAACVKVVSGEERSRGGPDVRIKVDAKRYGEFGPKSREALFAHELYHLEVQYHDGGGVKLDVYGRPVIKSIHDDWCVNGFRQVAEWYGDAAIEVRSHRAVAEILSQCVLPLNFSDTLGPDTTVTVNGRPVETTQELGDALFGSPKPHEHTRECYDDPGPGHGSSQLSCDEQAAQSASEPEPADLGWVHSDEQAWRGLGVPSLRGVPGPVHGKLMDAGVKILGDLPELLSAFSNTQLAGRWDVTPEDVKLVRAAFDEKANPDRAMDNAIAKEVLDFAVREEVPGVVKPKKRARKPAGPAAVAP